MVVVLVILTISLCSFANRYFSLKGEREFKGGGIT
jgi:hypothetical protein